MGYDIRRSGFAFKCPLLDCLVDFPEISYASVLLCGPVGLDHGWNQYSREQTDDSQRNHDLDQGKGAHFLIHSVLRLAVQIPQEDKSLERRLSSRMDARVQSLGGFPKPETLSRERIPRYF